MAIDALARGMAAAAGGGGGGLDVGIDAGTGIRFTGTDPITIINTGVTAVTTPGDNDIAEDGTIKVANPGAENSADRVHYVKVKGINNAAFKDVDTVINDTKATSTNVPTTKAVYDELEKKLEADLDTTAFTNDNDHVPSSKLVKEKLDDKLEDSLTINGVSYNSNTDSYTLDGGDIDLTGYTAISSGTEEDVAATDSVNDGIAKVEYKADNRIPTANIDTDFPVTPDATHVLASTVASAEFKGTGTAGVNPKKGLVPAPGTISGTETRFLKADGTWDTPPNTEYSEGTGIDINNAGVISNTGVTHIENSDPADDNVGNGTFKVTENGTDKWIAIKGLDDAAYKDVDDAITSGSTSTNLPTTQAVADFVDTTIANLEKPVIFKGTVGTGGTVTSLPTAQASTRGYEYQAITAGTIPAAQSASGSQETYKIGDMLICALTSAEGVTPQTFGWVVNPSGDEPEGTVTSLTAEKGIVAYSTDPQTAGAGTIATQGKFFLNLKNDTQLQNPAVTGTDSADRLYPLSLDSNGKLATNVPWTDTTYEFADGYNASTNKAATVSTVTNAINALDVSEVTVGATKTINKISQADGKISVTTTDIQSATTSQKGLVQLTDSLTSTSATYAATASAVKAVNDSILSIEQHNGFKNYINTTSPYYLYQSQSDGLTYVMQPDGTMTISGSKTSSSWADIYLSYVNANITYQAPPVIPANDYVIICDDIPNNANITLWGKIGGATETQLGTAATGASPRSTFTVSADTIITKWKISITSSTTVNFVFKPLLVDQVTADMGFTEYKPYALSNVTITPELVELCDSGAKNLFNPLTAFSGNASFTVIDNNDGTYKVTGGSTESIITYSEFKVPTTGTYILSGCPSTGSESTYRLDIRNTSSTALIVDYGTGSAPISLTAGTTYRMTIRFAANYTAPTAGLIFKPMICTKAAWDISQKFVPYCKSNSDLTQYTDGLRLAEKTITSGSLDNVSNTNFAIYNSNVTGHPVPNTSAFVQTVVYSNNSAYQLWTQLNNASRVFIRLKVSGSWNPWYPVSNTIVDQITTPGSSTSGRPAVTNDIIAWADSYPQGFYAAYCSYNNSINKPSTATNVGGYIILIAYSSSTKILYYIDSKDIYSRRYYSGVWDGSWTNLTSNDAITHYKADTTTTIGTDWTLTSIVLQAPVDAIVSMTATAIWGSKAPRGIRITRTNTSATDGVLATIEVSEDKAQIQASGLGTKLNGVNTYYVWAKAKESATMPVYLTYSYPIKD